MKGLHLGLLLQLVAVNLTAAASIVYITDLPAFSSLAPCAKTVVSSVVQQLSSNACPASVTALESCACTKDQISASVSSQISSEIFDYCASTAIDDVSSAAIVFSNYCNQGAAAVTQPANPNVVSQYITDLPAFSILAPCASTALSSVVQALTSYDCPPGQSALASCACTKNQNSLAASETINSRVFEYCGSTHTEDVTSAQAIFAGYCGLGNGTSSFPTASALAGDVTYYITDLTQYSSLAPCAQTAISSRVLAQTSNDCPAGPAELVSCACVKDQNSQFLSGAIGSEVKDYCGSTALDDVSSAIAVFDYYCSAGNGQVKAQGVTASVTTTAAGGVAGGAKTTTKSSAFPSKTSSSGSSSGSGSGSGSDSASTTGPVSNTSGSTGLHSGGKKAPVGAIVGGVVGGIALIILVLIGVWAYRRRHNRPPKNYQHSAANGSSSPPHNDFGSGKAELASTSILAGEKPKFIRRKPAPTSPIVATVEPVSPIDHGRILNELHSPTPPQRSVGTTNVAEMQGQRDPVEVHTTDHNQPNAASTPRQQNPVEVHGQPYRTEMPDRNMEPVEMSATSGPFELHQEYE